MTPGTARTSLARLGSLAGPWRGLLGYAAFTTIVFVFALAYSLPHPLIVARILDEATLEIPVRVVPGEIEYAFPNGYRLENVRVSHRDDPSLAVELSEITVRTPLVGMLLGRVHRAEFYGRAYDGAFDGYAEQSEGRVATRLVLEDLSLTKLSRRLLPAPGSIGGSVTLELELSGDGKNTKTNEGAIQLRAENVDLEGLTVQGFTIPDLQFSPVELRGRLLGSRLQVESFSARGDEITAGATGDVLIREPVDRSVLNLQFELDVAASARPGLRVATSLLPPRKAGQKTWNLRGSLGNPSVR